jgi:hypothetical protein
MLRRSKGKIVRKQDAPAGGEFGKRKGVVRTFLPSTRVTKANVVKHGAFAQTFESDPGDFKAQTLLR